MKTILQLAALSMLMFGTLSAQEDSVDVIFYYSPDSPASNVYLPGEFNGWTIGNNTRMTFNSAQNRWERTYRLRVGGPNPPPNPSGGIPGAYQYKFYADGTWLQDPLNPRRNPQDFNNSYLYIKDPTIHYLLPNNTLASGTVRSSFPEISAYIFPTVNGSVDTSTIVVTIDGTDYTGIGSGYDSESHLFTYIPSQPLEDGPHTLKLTAGSDAGNSNFDTTSFVVSANLVQFFTLPAETWKPRWRLQGGIFSSNGGFDSTVISAQIIRPDTTWNVRVINGKVDTTLDLLPGDNSFILQAQIGQHLQQSQPLDIFRKTQQNPFAQINISQNGSLIDLDGTASSDPQGQNLTYLWKEDAGNPEPLGINGTTSSLVSVPLPSVSGEYYLQLRVEDTEGNADSSRIFFSVDAASGQLTAPGLENNPQWVREGRVYLMFIKGFTPEGTIQAATDNLDYVRDMGFNIIWVLPVMEIPGNVDNQINIGYYIEDFMNIEQSYGTNQDFKDFVQTAHNMGIKVILDVTPNHSGNLHRFAQEAMLYQDFSQYWNYYQTQYISHDDRGQGQCSNGSGIFYYCSYSEVLLNWNWTDADARQYMIDVYKYWMAEFGVDGFRFDVYWGPHNRYGEGQFGIPLREQLKHLRADILLLGETD